MATSIAAVFLTHALAYHLIALLPDAATRAAGLLGGHEPSVSMLQQRLEQRSYSESLTGMLRGNFGMTVHSVPVASELVAQIGQTVPRIVAASLLVVLAVVLATVTATARTRSTPILYLFCLVPPYVYSFVALFLLLILSAPMESAFGGAAWWAVVLSSAVAPSALAASQASRKMAESLMTDYALFGRSMGLEEHDLRRLLRHEVWVAIAPSMERTLLWLFLSVLFGEIVLSLPGFGSSFATALRSSDLNMLLAQIVAIAVLSNSARAMATILRTSHGIID